MKKRIVSILLVVLTLCMFCMPANAASTKKLTIYWSGSCTSSGVSVTVSKPNWANNGTITFNKTITLCNTTFYAGTKITYHGKLTNNNTIYIDFSFGRCYGKVHGNGIDGLWKIDCLKGVAGPTGFYFKG